ncbi:endodeoxyribonuclease [Mortierella sp. 14UC]|nr:endodeoxyribonuclease [Mortierella sp. 14UC]
MVLHEDREHATYGLEEGSKNFESGGAYEHPAGDSGDGGSDDFIHECYFEDREDNEKSERGFGLQDRVTSSSLTQGGETYYGRAEQQDASSPSSGWESIHSSSKLESLQPHQRQQQQQQQQGDYCYDYQENDEGDIDEPELEEDILDDMLFDAHGLPEDVFVVTPPKSIEPTRHYSLSHHDSSSSYPTEIAPPTAAAATTRKTLKFMTTTERPRDWVLEKLESMACKFLHDLSIDIQPVVQLACRNRADAVVYDEEHGIIRRRTNYSGLDQGPLEEQMVLDELQENEDEEEEVASDDGAQEMSSSTERSRKRRRLVDISELKPRRRMRKNDKSFKPALNSQESGDGIQDINDTHDPKSSTSPLPSPAVYLGPTSSTSALFTKHHPFWTKRTSRVLRATELIHGNLSKDAVSSKRDLFYRDVLAFGSQLAVDSIVEDLACTLEVPRECLNVVAGSRSVVFGSVRMLVKVPGRSIGGDSNEGGEKASSGGGGPEWLQEEIAKSPFAKTLQASQSQSHNVAYNKDKDKGMRSDYEEEHENDDPLYSRFFQTSYNTLVPIPVRFADIDEIEIHPRTRFVLVIEKEASFANLISLGFCATHGPCILLTSKGFPDHVSRRLLKVLSDMMHEGVFVKKLRRSGSVAASDVGSGGGMRKSLLVNGSSSSPSPVRVPRPLEIPLLALVDCDPHGIEIYLTYRCGSVLSAYDNANLAVPELKCLGQVPSDWDVFLNGYPPPHFFAITTPSMDGALQERENATAANCQGQMLALDGNNNVEGNEEAERLRSRLLQAFIPLTERDRKKLERLLTAHPYIRQHARWRAQILRMLEVNGKTELQSLHLTSSVGVSGSGTFEDVVEEAGSEGGIEIGSGRGADGSGGIREGEEGQQASSPSALVLYLQHKLQDPASWL